MPGRSAAAPDARFDSEGDWIARQFFDDADLRRSPEEYAARFVHLWGCYSLHLYRRYEDEGLGTWVRRLGEILSDPDELERCRRRYLTDAEYAAVQASIAEGF